MLPEKYEEMGRGRLIEGDIFEQPGCLVIPIMTKGRAYGSISKRAAQEVDLPDLSLTESCLVEVNGKQYMFVALWSDNNAYTHELIYACTRSCMNKARVFNVPLLVFPLLGGNQGERFIGAMEKAVQDQEDFNDVTGLGVAEVVFITNKVT